MRLLCFQPACSKESQVLFDQVHRQACFIFIVDALGRIYGRDTLFFTVEAHRTPQEDTATSAFRPLATRLGGKK